MRIATILMLLSLLVSCKSETSISGEVYVFTEGRDTVKLSGSEVFIFKLSEVQPVLNKLTPDPEEALEVFKEMPKPVAMTVTDADGRFEIKVPSGAYAVHVIESRKVGRSSEFYAWLVPVTNGKVTLNNSNLINLTP